MLCLAREPPPGPLDEFKSAPHPSSVYISYDNGDTFTNKSELFMINDTTTNKLIESSIDQFTTHPVYNSVSRDASLECFFLLFFIFTSKFCIFCLNSYGVLFIPNSIYFKTNSIQFIFIQIVFTDPKNQIIFTNVDFGRTFKQHKLNFTPSEVSFYEHDSRTFLILDKNDRTVSHFLVNGTNFFISSFIFFYFSFH